MKEKYLTPLQEEIILCVEQCILDNSDVERVTVINAIDSGWTWNNN